MSPSKSPAKESKPQLAPQPPTKKCELNFVTLKLCGAVKWEVGPQLGKTNKLDFEIWDPATQLGVQVDHKLEVKPWMPDMGHGVHLKPTVEVDAYKIGHFRVKDIQFSMEGGWELWFNWMDSQVVFDQAKVEVSL